MSATEAKTRIPLEPSSDLLDLHLAELAQECARFVALVDSLRSMGVADGWLDEEVRESTEGTLYASLSHLSQHVQPALDEMDRLLEAMPAGADDDSTE